MRLRLTPADQERSRYLLVPFEVRPGCARLRVAYDLPAGAVVDLGLADPRGTAFPDFPGFRGWSGSFRSEAVLTAAAATPGYLPGPIPAGTWHALLGLHRLPPGGADLELTVDASEDAGPPPHVPPAPASPPRDRGPGWFAGDLHAHTHHSDAPGTLDDLVAAARALGLDFLAVTDHNTVSHVPHLAACPPDLLLVPGEEVTTRLGHASVWGLGRLTDFRCETAAAMRVTLEGARARGGVVSPNHPAAPGMEWTFGLDLPFDCLEVWHGPSAGRNASTLEAWDQLLRTGRRVVAVGGSDEHCRRGPDRLARPTTWVRADRLAVPAVLAALRSGRVVIGERGGERPALGVERDGRRWEVGDTVPPGGAVRVRRTAGARLVTALGEVPAGAPLDLRAHRYVRAELRGAGGGWDVTGLTNPVWAAQE